MKLSAQHSSATVCGQWTHHHQYTHNKRQKRQWRMVQPAVIFYPSMLCCVIIWHIGTEVLYFFCWLKTEDEKIWINMFWSLLHGIDACWGCWHFSYTQVYFRNIHALNCMTWKWRKRLHLWQVADVSIPVIRSLSGPITAWSPSAVNSMLSLRELMSRFRVCPRASFGPAMTKTATARIPEGAWQ